MKTYKLAIRQQINPDVIKKIETGKKKHYIICADSDIIIDSWIDTFKSINAGDATLSVTMIDDPKHPEEYIIKQYTSVAWEKIMLTKSKDMIAASIGGRELSQVDINEILENNGMTIEQFNEAYFHKNSNNFQYGLIIHITDLRYGNKK